MSDLLLKSLIKCSNNGEGQWSTEGVTTKVLDNGIVQCNSTHLTSFTVIVAINDVEVGYYIILVLCEHCTLRISH